MNFSINCHSSIQIDGNIYIDPFRLSDKPQKAKYIFITHTHFDHLSPEDILKISSPETTIIATQDATELESMPHKKIIYVKPNQKFTLDDLSFETIPAYNTNKNFHPKQNNWVGYKITTGGVTYLIAGDSDNTKELSGQTCDVLFVPIGGTYTMTATEAGELTNIIKPKIAVPTHYGEIVGEMSDADVFAKTLSPDIKLEILIK